MDVRKITYAAYMHCPCKIRPRFKQPTFRFLEGDKNTMQNLFGCFVTKCKRLRIVRA